MTTLKVTTKDTTLEALLTGKARLATYQNWPNVQPLELRDPFQDAMPCWHHSPDCDGCHLCDRETAVALWIAAHRKK